MNFDRSIFIGKFTEEARDLLHKLNDGLIELEKTPDNHDAIKKILRAAHTLKGSSKIMRFHHISELSHKIEGLLISLQDNQLKLEAEHIDLLLRGTDLIEQCIKAISEGRKDSVEIVTICQLLDKAARGEALSEVMTQLVPGQLQSDLAADVSEAPLSPAEEEVNDMDAAPSLRDEQSQPATLVAETIRVGVDKLDNAVRLVGEIAVNQRKSGRHLSILKDLQRIARKHAKRLQRTLQTNSKGAGEKIAKELVRESTQLVKGIEHVFKEGRDEMVMMEIALTELYEEILNMRMLPLSIIFDTFPRAVRDMARYFNKQIDLRISGEETTLDKKIIEQLQGPLIHILRNSIDHGIETAEERRAQGKPPVGVIRISALHKSGHIEIEIADDGRGIQLEKLRQQVVERGFFTEEKAQTLHDGDLVNLVFLPRISTSEIITDISGRGLGMDIVKTNIEHLKGSVSLKSKVGQGTTCLLTLPITLTTLRCLIVAALHTRFAIPITSVEETLQPEAQEFIHIVGRRAIRVRNQIIYVVKLADVLHLPEHCTQDRERHFVLIVRAGEKRIGLLVDEILDEQDVVVKQLPPHMQHVKSIAGATVASDNTITLILYVPEVIRQVKATEDSQRSLSSEATSSAPPRILVVDDSLNTGEIEQRILEANGYQVDLAEDGFAALEHLAQKAYDLIVTDIEMPRMNGFTLTEQVRQMPRFAHIPIIIVTSLERESDKWRGLQVGANAYIMKGNFEQHQLIETVKSLI